MKKYQYKVKGVDYEVEIAEVEGNIAKVNVNGIPFEIELQKPINAAKHPTMNNPKVTAPETQSRPLPVSEGSGNSQASKPSAPQPCREGQGGESAGGGSAVKAPLPGTITEIKVQVGQQVSAGDTVLILEAMKMQNNIESEYSGKVLSINVNKGDTVMEGAVLLTIG
jgi:biotin carboxyl carrier protein